MAVSYDTIDELSRTLESWKADFAESEDSEEPRHYVRISYGPNRQKKRVMKGFQGSLENPEGTARDAYSHLCDLHAASPGTPWAYLELMEVGQSTQLAHFTIHLETPGDEVDEQGRALKFRPVDVQIGAVVTTMSNLLVETMGQVRHANDQVLSVLQLAAIADKRRLMAEFELANQPQRANALEWAQGVSEVLRPALDVASDWVQLQRDMQQSGPLGGQAGAGAPPPGTVDVDFTEQPSDPEAVGKTWDEGVAHLSRLFLTAPDVLVTEARYQALMPIAREFIARFQAKKKAGQL